MQRVNMALPGGADGADPLMGPKIKANDLKQAAQQFEAIFLRSMLKEMRKTNELFESKDDPLGGDSVKTMQSFYDDTLCNVLAKSQGIGIAAAIVKQLSPSVAKGE